MAIAVLLAAWAAVTLSTQAAAQQRCTGTGYQGRRLPAPVQVVHDGLDLGQGAAQVLVGIQPHGCHLDQDCVDAGLDHVLQQLRLGLVPQVRQGGQPQSSAHLHARPLAGGGGTPSSPL